MKLHLQALLDSALMALAAELGQELTRPPGAQIDASRDDRHGDFASNLAMVLAKPLGKPPRAVAEALIRHLPASPKLAKVEIAGPGFLNFFLAQDAFQSVVKDVLDLGAGYGQAPGASRGRVMIEFVSANPTGPMHVGHGRGAAYGDSLANILAARGWDVHREYYINDAGRQVDVLALSVWIRYLRLFDVPVRIPKRGYPGDYVKQTALRLKREFGDRFVGHAWDVVFVPLENSDSEIPDDADELKKALLKREQEEYLDELIESAREFLDNQKPGNFELIKKVAVDDQLVSIRATLDVFGVRFDRWYSERELVASGAVKKAVERLDALGHVFPEDGAIWLRTRRFGDEKDRVLIKADGSATYFTNDLAYHLDKLDRGFPSLLDVWGADHHGYIGRVRAAIEALTGKKDALKVQLMQFVTLSSGRMGKRSGNFVTLQDLVSEAGKDATRFFYLLRSHDQHLEFDIELARSQSNDNPVYYVQYAHARICSVFRQLAERGGRFDASACAGALHRLTEPQEKSLLVVLQKYPEVLAAAAEQFSPHMLAFYLRDLADVLHSYYNAHKFLVDDPELQTARLALIAATRQVLANALGLLGVSAPEQM